MAQAESHFLIQMFRNILRDYKDLFSDRKHSISIIWGILLFGIALIIQAVANRYVGQVVSIAVPDLILDHIPAYDIDALIIKAVLFVTAVTFILIIMRPKCFGFGLKTLALFIITRSVMISLTHLGANPHQLMFSPHDFGYSVYNLLYNSTNDFFFSAHTGAPLLVALIYWQERKVRYFYITTAILFGASMLIAHIHYSIDVAAAPFMTYGIFHAAKILFRRDYDFSRGILKG